MASAEPAPAARPAEVRASVLAAFQLVEDAHYFGTDRRAHRMRARSMAERAVSERRRAREARAG